MDAANMFARQRWRAWIETGVAFLHGAQGVRSPVSDGGRGLKPPPLSATTVLAPFARQRWRAWIETARKRS